jgi:hypothetical protein
MRATRLRIEDLRKVQPPSQESIPKKREFKPLSIFGPKTPASLKAKVSSAMANGLALTKESRSRRPDLERPALQSAFVDGMLDECFGYDPTSDKPKSMKDIKDHFKIKNLGSLTEVDKVYTQIDKLISDAVQISNGLKDISVDINMPEYNLAETVTILASYIEEAQIMTTTNKNGFGEAYYSRHIPSTTYGNQLVTDLNMRIRSTSRDLEGHKGGRGHVHLELTMFKKSINKEVSINIHLYPNLEQFTSVL